MGEALGDREGGWGMKGGISREAGAQAKQELKVVAGTRERGRRPEWQASGVSRDHREVWASL